MSAGHTPGPWQGCLHLRADADERCGCGYRGGIWSLTADVQICEMAAGSAPGDDMIPVSDRATQIADHWLIASAPDLLAVLEAIDDMWSDDGDGGRANPIEARSGRVREIWTQARAAIAKARGQS